MRSRTASRVPAWAAQAQSSSSSVQATSRARGARSYGAALNGMEGRPFGGLRIRSVESDLTPNHLQTRRASSYTLNSLLPSGFFGRSKPNPTSSSRSLLPSLLSSPIDSLRSSLSDSDLPSLRLSCRSILDRRKAGSQGEEPTLEEWQSVMTLLASEGSKEDLELLESIWKAQEKPSSGTAEAMVVALSKWSSPSSALAFFRTVSSPTSPHNLHLQLSNTSIEPLTEGLVREGDPEGALSLISGERSDQEPFLIVLRALAASPRRHSKVAASVFEKMVALGLEPVEEALLLGENIFSAAENEERVGWMLDGGKGFKGLRDLRTSGGLSQEGWNTLIRYEGLQRGSEAAWKMVGEMEQAGWNVDEETVSSMIAARGLELASGSSTSIKPKQAVKMLREVETRAGVKADALGWSVLIRAYLLNGVKDRATSPSSIEDALGVYDAMRTEFVQPTLDIVAPLLKGMAQSQNFKPHELQDVHSELLAAWDESPAISGETREFVQSAMRSYLKYLVNGVREKPILACVKVLQEMRERGIKLSNNSSDLSEQIIYLMQRAPNHNDAFRVYSFSRALDPRMLDISAYEGILANFAQLSTLESPIAPAQLFFEFMKDMRSAGISPTAKIYSILVNQYTKLLRRQGKNVAVGEGRAFDQKRAETFEALRRVHAHLKIDSFVDMDIGLLNSLMDGYSQVGAIQEVLEIWDDLLNRMAYEEDLSEFLPSVSIVFDACGFAGMAPKAKQIWAVARKRGLPLNQNNWAALLECYCRSGRVEAALGEVMTVGRDPKSRFEASEDILTLLLRFSARRRADYDKVSAALKEEFPAQWPRVAGKVKVDWETASS